MKMYEVQDREALLPVLLKIWEASVQATHLFLSDAEVKQIKEYVPQALTGVEHLIVAENESGEPIAFMGAEHYRLEMLFLSPEERGKGVGRQLLEYGVEYYGINELTVNEQNPQAVGFYEHMGFTTYKRTEYDEEGNPYPLLYMKRGDAGMKTIRLLYPDYISGGLETYYFGANLMAHILPQNENQKLVRVEIEPPTGKELPVSDGIYGKDVVIHGIRNAMEKISEEAPDRIITIGGNCMVSQAPFDYLHGKYENVGILWIDAHPDVSMPKDGYRNAHAMVLGSLLGADDPSLTNLMKNPKFKPDEILYIGLQDLHDYQQEFLEKTGVQYKVQTEEFVSNDEIKKFTDRFAHILIHFDIDVLDEHFFHSTYFANPELVGDGAGGGKMTMEKLSEILQLIQENADIVGFTIAEYLPFDEYRLHKMLSKIKLFKE